MMIETVNIADLHDSEFNPRVKLEKNSKEYKEIANSIREFGFVEPLVVNKHNMAVIGGHQRLAVMKDLGEGTIQCVFIDEPDQTREKALCVALNKIKGDWDMEKLKSLLRDEDVSIFPTGFEEGEVNLDDILGEEEPELDIPEEEPEAEAEEEKDYTTIIKIGNFSFVATGTEYNNLLNSIRDEGIFEPQAIADEMRRRILNG